MADPDWKSKLLAAASSATSAATDMIEAARHGEFHPTVEDTLDHLVDSLRLYLEAQGDHTEEETQLLGALVKFQEDRHG